MKITDIFGRPKLPDVYTDSIMMYEEKKYTLNKLYVFTPVKMRPLHQIYDGFPVDLIYAGSNISGYCIFKHEMALLHNPMERGTIITSSNPLIALTIHNVAFDKTKTNLHESVIKFVASHMTF